MDRVFSMPFVTLVFRYLRCLKFQTTEILQRFLAAFLVDSQGFGWYSSITRGVRVGFDADWIIAKIYWYCGSPNHETQFCWEIGKTVELGERLVDEIWLPNWRFKAGT